MKARSFINQLTDPRSLVQMSIQLALKKQYPGKNRVFLSYLLLHVLVNLLFLKGKTSFKFL